MTHSTGLGSTLVETSSRAAISDWETAYSNRKAIPDMAEWLADASRKSGRYLQSFDAAKNLGLPYGPGDRQKIDILSPPKPAGTLIFIHGGYWRASSNADHYHFAAGAVQRGWQVALVDYPLCPAVRISDISAGVVQAVARIVDDAGSGPVVLSGHSAGGQLASHVVSSRSGLPDEARRQIVRVVSLSGLHDLRPLVNAHDLNRDLRLTEDEAARTSPALDRPGHAFQLFCVCGGGELPEFRRQNELLANVWTGFGLPTSASELGEVDHFRLLDAMTHPDTELTRLLTNER